MALYLLKQKKTVRFCLVFQILIFHSHFYRFHIDQKTIRKFHFKKESVAYEINKSQMKILQSFFVFLGSFLLQNKNGPTYTTVMQDHNFEVRKYDSWVVAETVVESTHQDAGNEAFHILAGYIFGKNDRGVKIQMTAPVTQFEVSPGKYAVQFFMPAEWTLNTLPKPLDNRIELKQIPERRLLVVRYHGSWSEKSYNEELKDLNLEAQKLHMNVKDSSKPIWARYNSPMAPTPVRTNEIMYEIEA